MVDTTIDLHIKPKEWQCQHGSPLDRRQRSRALYPSPGRQISYPMGHSENKGRQGKIPLLLPDNSKG